MRCVCQGATGTETRIAIALMVSASARRTSVWRRSSHERRHRLQHGGAQRFAVHLHRRQPSRAEFLALARRTPTSDSCANCRNGRPLAADSSLPPKPSTVTPSISCKATNRLVPPGPDASVSPLRSSGAMRRRVSSSRKTLPAMPTMPVSMRCALRQELAANARAAAVGGDQHVALGRRAVREMRDDAACRDFLVAREGLAETHDHRRGPRAGPAAA